MAVETSLASHGNAPAAPRTDRADRPRFLTTDESAAFLRLSPRTLEKLRVLGGGPRFRKLGARVVYAVDDLCAWTDARAFSMTSDPGYVQRDSVL
ncbi:helix-turn-helix domain-containing protein [Pigmentiphaga sp.]|uniref:helix-turn-helix transcriptional regulator n=1 Tax=Pigmentiphaga sp. TaxID=1977564 RepID=UPI0025FDD0FE|nr:helix-turn-helix domain-containing protein [Pigmentiphaga sp.]